MSSEPLTVSMKTTIGLIISFMIFLVVSAAVFLLSQWDIGAFLTLVIFPPVFIVLLAFCWKRRRWAYIGAMVLGIFVVVATPASIGGVVMPPLLMWETIMATILATLMALEAFRAYSELKKPQSG